MILLVMSNIERNPGPEKVSVTLDTPGMYIPERNVLLSLVDLLRTGKTTVQLDKFRYLYYFKYYLTKRLGHFKPLFVT